MVVYGRIRNGILASVLVLALTHLSYATTYIFEETVWTRATWPDFKQDLPTKWWKLHETDLSRQLQERLQVVEASSLQGPYLEKIEPPSPRTPARLSTAIESHPLGKDEPIGEAVAAVQCRVCKIVLHEAWYELADWVIRNKQQVKMDAIVSYMKDTCHKAAPQLVLREWSIVHVLLHVPDVGQRESVGLRPRDTEGATLQELKAVRQACHALVQEPTANGVILTQVMKSKLDAMLRVVLDELDDSEPSTPQVEQPYFDACRDFHSDCRMWANEGECERNGQYMVGSGEWPGHCRLSCRECVRMKTTTALQGLSKSVAARIHRAKGELGNSLREDVCTAGGVCSSDIDLQQLVQNVLSGLAQGTGRGRIAGGGRPRNNENINWGEAGFTIDVTDIMKRAAMNNKMMVMYDRTAVRVSGRRGLSEALTGGRYALQPVAVEPYPTSYHAVAGRSLSQECLYITQGWWSYEICHSYHIRQFHVSDTGHPETVISLGTYDAVATKQQFSQGSPPISDKIFLAGGAMLPYAYVGYMYTRGSPCEIKDEAGHLQQISRQTEFRVACSPDEHMYIIPYEPQECQYIITLFTPTLCELPAFVPVAEDIDGEDEDEYLDEDDDESAAEL